MDKLREQFSQIPWADVQRQCPRSPDPFFQLAIWCSTAVTQSRVMVALPMKRSFFITCAEAPKANQGLP
jgi:hypothetical protein